MWDAIRRYIDIGRIGRPDWLDESTSEKRAIGYCLAEMKYYEDWCRRNGFRWRLWQNVGILSGVLATTLAIIPQDLFYDNSAVLAGAVRVIPAALTAAAATVLSSYNYKSDHVRQGVTHDALQGELAKFVNGASPYDKVSTAANVSRFVVTIRAIISDELSAWRDALEPSDDRPKPPGQPGGRSNSDAAAEPPPGPGGASSSDPENGATR